MSDTTLLALISLGSGIVTAITTIVTTIIRGRASARHSAKQSILQMIMEDHQAVIEGHLPTNYQNILDEYDEYHRTGGNSYCKKKVDEYIDWYAKIESRWKNGKMSQDTSSYIKSAHSEGSKD